MVQIQTDYKQLHFLTKVMLGEITSISKFLHKEYWLHKIGLPQTTKKDKCKKITSSYVQYFKKYFLLAYDTGN